jgi:hypothetical protein
MSTEQPQNQQRQSYRFAVGDAVRGELVLADRSRWPVRLIDQSAGGFAALTDGPAPVGCGDVVQLRTDSLCSEVRVVYATEIKPADDGGNAPAAASQFRLGLMRLGDLAVSSDEDKHGSRWIPWHVSLPSTGRGHIALFLAVVAIPIVVITVFGILLSARSSRGSSVHSAADDVYPAGTRPHGIALVEAGRGDLKHLPGASPFVTLGVIRELQLTESQVKEIRRILDETDKAITEDEEFRLLLDSSRQKVLNVLSGQQRQRWDAFSNADKRATEASRTAPE